MPESMSQKSTRVLLVLVALGSKFHIFEVFQFKKASDSQAQGSMSDAQYIGRYAKAS